MWLSYEPILLNALMYCFTFSSVTTMVYIEGGGDNKTTRRKMLWILEDFSTLVNKMLASSRWYKSNRKHPQCGQRGKD